MKVYEFSTWKTGEDWTKQNKKVLEVGKRWIGEKWAVSIGEWGVRSFLVLDAKTKEEARGAAIEEYIKSGKQANQVKVRNVTMSAKYNNPA